jgi:hypothetical protein
MERASATMVFCRSLSCCIGAPRAPDFLFAFSF